MSTQCPFLVIIGPFRHGNSAMALGLTLAERRELGSDENRNKSIKTLMAKFKRSAETIRKWRARGKAPMPDFSDKPRPGRPRSKAAKHGSIKQSARSGNTAPTITQRVNQQRQEPVSPATVRRVVEDGHPTYVARPMNRGQELREPNRAKRVVFCRAHAQAHMRKWVFVGRKFLYLYQNQAGQLVCSWQAPGSGDPFVFHFYGAVGYGFKSCLIFTDPSPPTDGKTGPPYTADAFVNQVLPKLQAEIERCSGGSRVQVILDHASQHDADISKAALASRGVNVLQDFPAQCWDINIIDGVWERLAKRLQQRRPVSVRGWRAAIKGEWKAIEQSTIDRLVEEVKGRMAQIVEKDGAWLKEYVTA